MNFETLNQSLTDEIKFANKEMDEDLETLLNQACQEMYVPLSPTCWSCQSFLVAISYLCLCSGVMWPVMSSMAKSKTRWKNMLLRSFVPTSASGV